MSPKNIIFKICEYIESHYLALHLSCKVIQNSLLPKIAFNVVIKIEIVDSEPQVHYSPLRVIV